MYLPPNSFSIRLPTTTYACPGGSCWSMSKCICSRLMKKPSTRVTITTATITALGRPTTAVTYRRNISYLLVRLEHGLEQRLAELAAGREVAAQDDPAALVPLIDAIDEHLPALRHHHAADRIGHHRVD